MNIKAIGKAKALAALYNASRPQGMGFFQADSRAMTESIAQEFLDAAGPRPYFDYLKGRVLKVGFESDELELRLYDRDNGPGAGEAALRAAGA